MRNGYSKIFLCCVVAFSTPWSAAEVKDIAYRALDRSLFKELYKSDFEWAVAGVPLFECSDRDITWAYSFRWRVYRRHIVHTKEHGYIVTEFLPPVSWAGPHNTIAGSAGHHIYEGRWLKDPAVMDNYSRFWFSEEAKPRAYTSWLTNAIYARALVDTRIHVAVNLLDQMAKNLQRWIERHFDYDALCFVQSDTWDGGEDSISSGGCRVSVNAVMFGEMEAFAKIREQAGTCNNATELHFEVNDFRESVVELLWNPTLQFFTGYKPKDDTMLKAIESWPVPPNSRCAGAPEWPTGARIPVRELLALSTPFYFGLIKEDSKLAANYSRMWHQLLDEDGFAAKWGPRTAERRHAAYNFSCDHPCTWNGPSWPFETSRLLTGLANFLNKWETHNSGMSRTTWLALLQQYAQVHTRSHVYEPSDLDGRSVDDHPWIGEDIHPDDGHWIAREYMHSHEESDWRRGYLYNHATFCDLVITGLVGLRPRNDNVLEINPLIDSNMPFFALEGVAYHGRELNIVWDVKGSKYSYGKGLFVWVNGKLLGHSMHLKPLLLSMPDIKEVSTDR